MSVEEPPNHNFQLPQTPLFGRRTELDTLQLLLSQQDTSLLTIVGTPGAGKTRLALELAALSLSGFPDGVWFVNLTPITEPELVISHIAQTLGLREEGARPLLETVQDFLRTKRMLLILDNFEQVISASSVVAELLKGCPFCKILITSRIVLHLRAEKEFPLSPLPLPSLADSPTVESIAQSPAVQLFVRRARDARPDLALTSDNVRAIAEICHRLDGLPLAIELAAARIKLLPPRALLARLDHRLQLLTTGAQDLPPHQRTLRATIDWSYDLLGPGEKTLLRRLSVFVGGGTLEAVEAVCAREDDLRLSLLDLLSSLIDKSLIGQEETTDGEPRCLMLETIAEYSRERLGESGEELAIRHLHADYFHALATRAAPELRGPQQEDWFNRLEKENGNLRAALAWIIERQEPEAALGMGADLWRFWLSRGYHTEGARWLMRILERDKDARPSTARAHVLNGAGALTYLLGDSEKAIHLYQESLAIRRALGDKKGVAASLTNLGMVAQFQGEHERAASLFEQALQFSRELGDKRQLSYALVNLGSFAKDRADYELAQRSLDEAQGLTRELGDLFVLADITNQLGMVALEQGDYTRAATLATESLVTFRGLVSKLGISESLQILALAAYYRGEIAQAQQSFEQALTISREIQDKWGMALCLNYLGRIAERKGDYARAAQFGSESLVLHQGLAYKQGTASSFEMLAHLALQEKNAGQALIHYRQAVTLYQEIGNQAGIVACLEGLAELAWMEGQFKRGVRLFAAAQGLREARNLPMRPIYRSEYEERLAAARAHLAPDQYDSAWAEGREMNLEQSIVYALAEVREVDHEGAAIRPRPTSELRLAKDAFGGLTARERELVTLIARGKSNREIAQELVVGIKTVEAHITRILNKLGFTSRTQIAAWAVAKGLAEPPADLDEQMRQA